MERRKKESRAENVYDGALFCGSPVYRMEKTGPALPGRFRASDFPCAIVIPLYKTGLEMVAWIQGNIPSLFSITAASAKAEKCKC